MTISYPAVTVVGGMLSGSLVQRIGDGATDLPGSDAEAYGLQAGESVRREANSAFAYLKDVWRDFAKQRERAGDTVPARLTRERWLLVLLRKLGYDGIEALPGGITVDDKPFPISHQWQTVPVHLLGWGVDLDTRTAGTRGAATAAPHATVQQVLNRADKHLWALLSNGQRLRLLRDSTSLVGAAYLEFDLEAIFDGDLFPDFILLYRTAHASRLAVRDPETGPSSCFMEAWRAYGAVQGERALEQLRGNVKRALELLGTGFLGHPNNPHLRRVIGTELSLEDFQRSLLRLVYRLLFWFVAEDRGALLDPAADPEAARRYDVYFSARRLRDLAVRRRHSRHGDLWEAAQLVFGVLGTEGGWPQLGLPGIGGLFEDGALDQPLSGARLTNTALLQAVEALAVLPARGHTGRQRVDFRHLGAEELGSVYESLLELRPRWDLGERSFQLEQLAGNERKTTGSYYTPSSLVECLLDSALDPLLDEATALPTPEERKAALRALTVCDPACGSGHFLIAAARRIAKRLAIEETDELEPPISAVQAAMREVVSQNIYGVDVNEMAAELAKVSLWLEAMEPGRPLSYLDSNIRVGNSLLGVTPRLLANGIPDTAFAALEGDDKKVVTSLRRQNAQERGGQVDLFAAHGIPIANAKLADESESIIHADPRSLADVHVQARRAKELEGSEDRRRRKLVADAWCAAFVQPKTEETRSEAITEGVLKRLAAGEGTLDSARVEETVEELTRQYRFFHWHIEFPHIFRVPEWSEPDSPTGWHGGFSCVLGNPPWERVKLQEQEFFAARDVDIATAPNAAERKRRIAALVESDEPSKRALHEGFRTALHEADGVSHVLRSSGRYPLTGRGDINTYAVFAETARIVLHPRGQLGMILPTGIATDATTQEFFKDAVLGKNLVNMYDFENEDKVFPNVHHAFRFALLTLAGHGRPAERVSLVFRVRQARQIEPRAYSLTPAEITLLNPNTGTCPVFISRRDAEITIGIYQRVPVLWREEDPQGNLWQLSFMAMFHMANDSGLFHTAEQLNADHWTPRGNVFVREAERMLPLYEAKMISYWDHRMADIVRNPGATQRQNVPSYLSDIDREDPNRAAIPFSWVNDRAVEGRLGNRWASGWLLGWRDITAGSNERTMISAVIPRAAAGDTILLALPSVLRAGLHANLSSFVLDFAARQKASGLHLKYFVTKQLPVLPPDRYDEHTPWDHSSATLDVWVAARALELTFTTYDIAAYAKDFGDDGPPFRWDPGRREMMRAELDAAYFHLYSIERDDVDYIMDTFKVVRQKDEAKHGEYRTKRLILERYDSMATAISTGVPYQTPLDPPPGHGPRHPAEGETR
jgi:hypothetical protein